jgi:hypothetical protein
VAKRKSSSRSKKSKKSSSRSSSKRSSSKRGSNKLLVASVAVSVLGAFLLFDKGTATGATVAGLSSLASSPATFVSAFLVFLVVLGFAAKKSGKR